MFAAKRLGKAQQHLPPGITLVKADNFQEWQMDIRVLDDNPLYKDKIFRLNFKFGSSYPIEAPEVTFLNLSPSITTTTTPSLSTSTSPSSSSSTPSIVDNGARPVPMHPHVYSNGIICLDLLGSAGWSPVQSVESVCMSIQSMLTGNTKNERPPGDEDFCRRNRSRPKDIAFVYEDSTV
ncbi:putative ubiquitin conjugating enzyme [Phaeomoniella chlamydospora]|uniref:Putative ubiquitin conjugating enzyme n=1 Tax=Phaeomoniella chlamydospora TaxID=158046 RepID=A0A0G2EQ87_PHACM|nr:putative ubiquitin conjugating enzyme [Phaeomoniella chlamydospora]